MPRGIWVLDPDSGGVRVPEAIKRRTAAHLQQIAEAEFGGRYTRLDIRFRAVFCYVDAYTEPEPPGPSWPLPNWPETTEQYFERLCNTPTHLCRLHYFGPGDRWSFGFYTLGLVFQTLITKPAEEPLFVRFWHLFLVLV